MWRRKLLYPGHTLPTAAAPVLVACGLALHDRAFAAGPALLAFAAGWLIQLGGVLTDNYENLVRQPEDREHPELVEALRLGTLTLGQLKAAILACYGMALLAGGALLMLAGPFVLWIGLASIAASWLYSAGPYPIGKLGLADPLFFVFFGVVSVLGAYYVQAQALPFSALALSLPVGALTTNILIIDDIRDRAFDAVKGKRTVAVRFGAQWSRVEFLLLLLCSFIAPLWFWLGLAFSAWVLLTWLTLPLAIATARAVLTLDGYEQLLPVTPRAGRLLLAYCALLAVGAAVS
ncbi:MAG TPA: 1,4-dihydroxy-2-naphthoate octaprenyltransferase [Burkholderiales bacterium]|nr:1,4-dihydroxy-2-naphthoate octaprenyltransferase [Burkholderiales bacterium]